MSTAEVPAVAWQVTETLSPLMVVIVYGVVATFPKLAAWLLRAPHK